MAIPSSVLTCSCLWMICLFTYLFMWKFFFIVYVCTNTCMLGAHGGHKRALDLLKLELWAVGSHYVPEITTSPVQDEQAD